MRLALIRRRDKDPRLLQSRKPNGINKRSKSPYCDKKAYNRFTLKISPPTISGGGFVGGNVGGSDGGGNEGWVPLSVGPGLIEKASTCCFKVIFTLILLLLFSLDLNLVLIVFKVL